MRSQAFRRAIQRAVELVARRGRLAPLFRLASQKLNEDHRALRGIGGDVSSLVRMVRAAVSGRYGKVPVRSLVAVVAALIYFVNPLDLVPDLLPALGYADDAVVFLWVLSQLRKDLDAFLAWEGEWGDAIDVEASRVDGALSLPQSVEEPKA